MKTMRQMIEDVDITIDQTERFVHLDELACAEEYLEIIASLHALGYRPYMHLEHTTIFKKGVKRG